MGIGEFGGAAAQSFGGGPLGTLPLYFAYEAGHAALKPARAAADMTRLLFRNPLNPWAHTAAGRSVAAQAELFERATRRYNKPVFGLTSTLLGGTRVAVEERVVWERPFCRLIHFKRALPERTRRHPKLLIVAPMSGHYATLLRGTVEAFLPNHEVFITDWTDARVVPVAAGAFDLDGFIDYVIGMLHKLGPDTHVLGVCQPAVPVMAAVARMEEDKDPNAPASMILMGGPIDTRINPTGVNTLAKEHGTDWFRRNVITTVPWPHAGFMRQVYPGFLQLTGFVSMNLDRHMTAHWDFFNHIVDGDGDSAEKHREFYDEYLAVMDLTAEFYLQTVDTVFVRHALPRGEMLHHGQPVRPAAITRCALMTVEGERDDISGVGQTEAAQELCSSIPQEKRVHYVQPRVGHYGVFNGSRFRAEIAPRIRDFILSNELKPARTPAAAAAPKVAAAPAPRAAAAAAPKPAPARQKFDIGDGAIADDLTRISGISLKVQIMLHGEGIFHFWQIAKLTPKDVARLEAKLGRSGRIARERWIEQATRLAENERAS